MRRTIQGGTLVRPYSSGVPACSLKKIGESDQRRPRAGDPASPPLFALVWGGLTGENGGLLVATASPASAGNSLGQCSGGCVSLLSALVCVGKPVYILG